MKNAVSTAKANWVVFPSGQVARARAIVVAATLALLTIVSSNAKGQTPLPSAPHPSKRYLVVVETSASMKARGAGMLQAIQDLLRSRLGGEASAGDSLGLWTFDSEFHSGKFPLQKWTNENQADIAKRVLGFLQIQKYDGTARLAAVMPEVAALCQSSECLTVFLVTDGMQEIGGTPFDKEINEGWASWRAEQERAHMPLITVLRVKRGAITDFRVNTPPWPVELPGLAPVVKQKPPATAPATAVTKPVSAGALVFSGKSTANPPAVTPPAVAQPVTNLNAPTSSAAKSVVAVPSNTLPATNQLAAANASTNPPAAAPATPVVSVDTASEPVAAQPSIPNGNITALAEPEPPLHPAAPPTQAARKIPLATATAFLEKQRNLIGFVSLSVLLLAGLFKVSKMLRPAAPAQRISLITRSLERDK